MFYILYDSATGEYISTATAIASALPAGTSALPYENAPDLVTNAWDATQRMLVPRSTPRIISRQTFMDRLGDTCVVAVQYAAHGTTIDAAQLRAWLLRFTIVNDIDVADPRTVAGVDALIAGGLLAANRRDAVLA